MKAGYATTHATIEFTMPAEAVSLTAGFAAVPSATWPTNTAPDAANATDLSITYYKHYSYESYDEAVGLIQSGYDICIGVHTNLTEAQIAEIMTQKGYSYYLYIPTKVDNAIGNYMLSKYPITHKDILNFTGYEYSEADGKPVHSFAYVELDVSGISVDMCFGAAQHHNGWGSDMYGPWVLAHAAETTNPFILVGYSFQSSSDFSAIWADKVADINTNDGNILFTSGVGYKSGSNSRRRVTATLQVAKE